MNDLTDRQVGEFIKEFGHYRTQKTGLKAQASPRTLITQPVVLSLGLRETYLRNIEGGAVLIDGRWVKPTRADLMDVGPFQISRTWHLAELKLMAGVVVGSWGPAVPGRNAAMGGYCPQFEDSINFTIRELEDSIAYARERKVFGLALQRFMIAAHNCGRSSALAGYRAGNVDRETAGGDYSAWVMRHVPKVERWLDAHPNWKVGD